MKKDFTGVFYFERTTNSNLLGEFSNSESETIMTESAIASGDTNDFEGVYTTTWFDFQVTGMNMEIKRAGSKYEIIWIDKEKKPIFKGEGFLAGNKLIGFYTKNV